MLSSADFLEIISGRRRGLVAAFCRPLFRLAAVPYGVAVRLRNLSYDLGWKTIHPVKAPVISVGNLTTGGTGKTPMVSWLAQWYRGHGLRVAIISRGYGAEAGARNDEALELERQLPDVPHLQNPDRVQAAETAIEELESQIILLDDAFQHRRIRRDLDVVLVDALVPFGFGNLLPRGLLREPKSSLRRAQTIAVSRADLVSDAELQRLCETLKQMAPQATILTASHEPQVWRQWNGSSLPISDLQERRIAAFCGIGNPEGFRLTLQRCGLQLAAFRAFPDHHPYADTDLQSIAKWARSAQAEAIVCTAKDIVKLQTDSLHGIPVWSLEVGLTLGQHQAAFEQQLAALLPTNPENLKGRKAES